MFHLDGIFIFWLALGVPFLPDGLLHAIPEVS
jgi:hypothetical protein